jgi:hypothetical protein
MTQSISGEEAVEPETISESSSPITLKFWHNLAFESARFLYIGDGSRRDGTDWDEMGRDVDGTGWDGTGAGRDGMRRAGTGRNGTEPQQRVAGYS